MIYESNIVNSIWPRVDIPLVSLHKYLLQKLDKFCDQYLIECETDNSYAFHELAYDSRRLANAWRNLGLKEGDVFGIIGPNCYQYIALYIAGIIAGGVASGIRSTDSFREVADKVIQQNIKYLAISNKNIINARKLSEGISITQKIILFNGGNKLSHKFELYSELIHLYEPVNDDNMFLPNDPKETLCLITATSGSLSPPKAVAYTHYGVVSAIEITSMPSMFAYAQSDVVSAHSQFAHHSAIFQVFTAIATGSRIAIMPLFDGNKFVDFVSKYSITSAILPPPSIISLLKDTENCDLQHKIESLTKIICCGSSLPKNIGQQFVQRFNQVKDFRQALFQSECLGPVSMMIKGSTEYDCVGYPLPNVKFKIIEPRNGESLGPNQHGELCVLKEDALPIGYYNNKEATKRLIDSDGWIRTGDLGFYDDDRMLYITESMENMITSGGLLIVPSELEGFLLSHKAVREAAVIGLPDDNAGQVPIGFVLIKPEYCGKLTGFDIQLFVNDQLPKRRKLREVHIVNSFPKTIFGKIIKRQLRDDLLFNINKRRF